MSDNITAIGKAVRLSPAKQQFLDMVGQLFDSFCHSDGASEPCAVVVAFVDANGYANANWMAIGEAEGKASLYTYRALKKLETKLAANDLPD